MTSGASVNRQYVLIDCNSFYASCEKLFRPDLKNKPVVVLSNNDGCIVARSAEVKKLNIDMAVPLFKVKAQLKKHDVAIFSSNYALYADISERVMSVLTDLLPQLEVYSIDEAFAEVNASQMDVHAMGLHIIMMVNKWVGMPVCVGIGPTKTLAKLANYAAKKYPATGGVVDLSSAQRRARLMRITPVHEIWGVGRKLSKQLYAQGIDTVWKLACSNPGVMRRRYSIVMERSIRELRGEACLALQESADPKQQIISSRSFGKKVNDLQHMREAVAEYTSIAVAKLRGENRYARIIGVSIRTSKYADKEISLSAHMVLAEPSCDSREFLVQAGILLKKIWKDGYPYAKAAVVLRDFYAPGMWQPDLFSTNIYSGDGVLMKTIDKINHMCPSSIWFAAQGMQQSSRSAWRMQRQYLSPAYTTRWRDIPLLSM